MKQNTRLLLSVIAAGALLAVPVHYGVLWIRAQEPVKIKKSVDQHWIVKDDVAPTDLQRQLEILNKAGTKVDLATNLFIVGNHFVIVINDGTSDEDEGQR